MQPLKRARPTDGVRAIVLTDNERTGKNWSKLDLERRLEYSAMRAAKEADYAATREALARQRPVGWVLYGLRDLWRALGTLAARWRRQRGA